MADKILHKRNLITGNNPTTASLEPGELAINVADGKLFIRQSGSIANKIVNVGESASFAATASYYQETDPIFVAKSGSFATTGSNTFNGLQTINGNVTINGTASIAYLNVSFESASVIYSSGSNQFGDSVTDIQSLFGTVLVSGSLSVTGSATIPELTGSLQGTASYALQALSASYAPDTTFPFTGSAIISGSLQITGSLSILDSLGFNNINTRIRTLYDSPGNISVDWNGRILTNTSGNSVVDWRLLRLIDSATTRSIDWGSRTLQDSTQTATLDWNSARTYLSNRISIDWGLRKLYDESPILSVDWAARTLHDTSTTQSVDWNNRYLIDDSSIQSIDWRTREAFDTNQSSSINWNGRLMRDSGAPGGTGIPAGSINWEDRQTLDTIGIISTDWSTRTLYDGTGNPSIYWNSRALIDSTGNEVLYWDVANQFNTVNNNFYQTTLVNNLDAFAQHSSNVVSSLTQNLSGEIIKIPGILDAGVSKGNLVYLNSDGIWYKTDQTSVSSSYMLGICVNTAVNKEAVFLEGNIGFTTASVADSPLVTGTNFYGVPIYISGSNGAMSTVKPTSGIVRIVGHAFYNSVTTPTNWLMKFRPSNNWYEI